MNKIIALLKEYCIFCGCQIENDRCINKECENHWHPVIKHKNKEGEQKQWQAF